MKALGYVRCSTDEQSDSGLGLEAQEAAVRAEAARKGWDVEIVADAGYSAKNLNRPAIQQALLRLDEGHHFHTLIVARLDRLSRSLLDFASLMERARNNGWAIVCLDANVDTSTPSGELMANVLASFAQFERQLIGERTKAALAEKRKQGVKLGRPRSVCTEATEAITRYRARGCSYREIATLLNAQRMPTAHGGKWHPETVRQIDLRE